MKRKHIQINDIYTLNRASHLVLGIEGTIGYLCRGINIDTNQGWNSWPIENFYIHQYSLTYRQIGFKRKQRSVPSKFSRFKSI